MKPILYKTRQEALDEIAKYTDAFLFCAETIEAEEADNRSGETISGVYHGINFHVSEDMFALDGKHTVGWTDNRDGKFVAMSLEDAVEFAETIACKIEYDGSRVIKLSKWIDGQDGEIVIDGERYLQEPEECRVPRREIDYTDVSGKYKIWRDLFNARVNQGLTLQDLADKTGIAKPHLSEIENGKRNISVNILYRILTALNMDIKIV